MDTVPDEKTPQEKDARLEISILTERRGKYAGKNWIEEEPVGWPAIHERIDGALLSD